MVYHRAWRRHDEAKHRHVMREKAKALAQTESSQQDKAVPPESKKSVGDTLKDK